MDLHIESRLARNPERVVVEMGGELLTMSPDSCEYHTLSGVAQRVWQLLEQPATVAGIAAILQQEFAVDGETCRRDTLQFARDLLRLGLVQRA